MAWQQLHEFAGIEKLGGDLPTNNSLHPVTEGGVGFTTERATSKVSTPLGRANANSNKTQIQLSARATCSVDAPHFSITLHQFEKAQRIAHHMDLADLVR